MESRGVLVPPLEVNRFRKALHRCKWLQQLRVPAHGDRFARQPLLAADDEGGGGTAAAPAPQPEPAAVGSWRYLVLSPAGQRALLESRASPADLEAFLRDCGLTCAADLHHYLVSCQHAAGTDGADGLTEGYMPPGARRRAAYLAAVAAADVRSVTEEGGGDSADQSLERKLSRLQALLPGDLSAAAVAPTIPRQLLADPSKLQARSAGLAQCAANVHHWNLDAVPARDYGAMLRYSLEHLNERASAVAALPARQQEHIAMSAAMCDNDATFRNTIQRLARESTARPSGAAAISSSSGECEEDDDDDAGRSEPVWSITLETVDEVAATAPARAATKFIHCRDHRRSTDDEQRLTAAAAASGAELLAVSASLWAGLLLNVPGLGEGSSVTTAADGRAGEDRTGAGKDHQQVIAVRKRSAETTRQNPILVLMVSYKGNIGTITRTAVQANAFEEIVIIDPADGSGRVLDRDIDYYSVNNAPLAKIRRFETAGQFLAHVRSDPGGLGKREMIATSLGPGSINAYSGRAKAALSSPEGVILLMGSEGDGLPEQLLQSSTVKLRIPSLSSSINVASAFSIILTVMLMRTGA